MQPFKKHKVLIISVSALLLLIFLIAATFNRNNVSIPENMAGTVAAPATGFFNGVFSSIGNFFADTFGGRSGKENEILKERNAQLEREIAALNEIKTQNESLKNLLQYKDNNKNYTYKACTIIAKSPDYWYNSFYINAGKSSGIEVNMPVVSGNGLVGKVVGVGVNWSKVVSITDESSAVSCFVERTRDNGTVKGFLNGQTKRPELVIEHLPFNSSPQPGDKIITSGLGGVFPKGIAVGEISEIEDLSDSTKRVILKPYSDFYRMEDVMVITDAPSSLEFQE